MASFTEEIKNEITGGGFDSAEERYSALYAFLRTSGSLVCRDGVFGFETVTENENTAYLFEDILTHDAGIDPECGTRADVFSGKSKFVFSACNGRSDRLIREMEIVREEKDGYYVSYDIPAKILDGDERRIAFIKGAFLGGGSCTIPDASEYSSKGYHFEIVFTGRETARAFLEVLCGFDIFAKLVERKDTAVVYIKSREVISDILNLISADACLSKLNELIELKERTNYNNRANNCSVSNIDKAVTASANAVMAIDLINQTIGLKSLDEPLFEVATARLADTSASMQTLADRLGITKSCLNHRMRKIIAIAKELGD